MSSRSLGPPRTFTPLHTLACLRGGVERKNRELKILLGKLCQETHLSWPQILLIVLFHLRTRPRQDLGIFPFELLFGHPPDTLKVLDTHFLNFEKGEVILSSYLSALYQQLCRLWRQSAFTQTLPFEENLHPFEPGHWIWIKSFIWKSPLLPKWKGSFQILLTTQTTMKVAERNVWIHWTHVKLQHQRFHIYNYENTHKLTSG